MELFDRILLFVTTVFLAVISLGILFLAFDLIPLDILGTSISYLNRRLDTGLVALLILLACVRLLYLALGPKRQAKSIVSRNEMGEIKISFAAVENLIKKSVREVKGARETKTQVSPMPGGVRVRLRAIINPECNIPAISGEIQKVIGTRIKETMGIEVEEIEIFVENIADEIGSGKIQ